jgi:hypothetical protein
MRLWISSLAVGVKTKKKRGKERKKKIGVVGMCNSHWLTCSWGNFSFFSHNEFVS